MKKPSLYLKRNELYRRIYVYTKRREVLREKFGYKRQDIASGKLISSPDAYKKAVRRLQTKMKIWKRELKAIDKKTETIRQLREEVEKFTGTTIIGKSLNTVTKLAKGIYFKYGIENKVANQKDLREFIYMKRVTAPTEYRSWLNKSFLEEPENKRMWIAFNEHITKKQLNS